MIEYLLAHQVLGAWVAAYCAFCAILVTLWLLFSIVRAKHNSAFIVCCILGAAGFYYVFISVYSYLAKVETIITPMNWLAL